ncbi:MAG: hypothetical protein EA420_08275 [Candidatus Competibacteraceae bacterium]|nr:MAG: hypothetical protein EA420_08275 [Candidatus Competibacteraceae bacterium]
MKMKNLFPMVLGVLSLLGVTATAIAAAEKAPVTGETAQAEIDEIITSTVRVHAVNLGKRQLTVQNQEGEIFTVDVPPEVRRLAEIKAGDLIVTEYRQALAVGLHKTDSSTGIRVRRESVSVERAGMDQPPGGVMRETVEILANVVAIDKARREVTIRGAEHTVVLTVPEDIDLGEIAVGDEVLALYVQELAINLEPAPAAAIEAWKSR